MFVVSNALLIGFCLPRPSVASDGWETNIVISAGVAENRLSLGQRPDATDGKDGRYDVAAMLGGDIKASFEGSLWRDIKANDGQKSWNMKVESPLNDSNISLNWNRAGFPAGYNVSLIDREAGRSVNMTTTGVYTYRNTGPRGINLVVTPPTGTTDSHVKSDDTAGDTGSVSEEVASVPSDNGGEPTDAVSSSETVQKEKAQILGRIILPPNPFGWSDDEGEIEKDKGEDRFTESVRIEESVDSEAYGYTLAGMGVLPEPKVAKPEAPFELDGRSSKKREGLHLFWKDDASGEYAFIVERKEGSGEKWEAIAAVWNGDRFYDDRAKLPGNKVFFYRVRAANSAGASGYSNVISFGPKGIGKIATASKKNEGVMETARTAVVKIPKKRNQKEKFDEASL